MTERVLEQLGGLRLAHAVHRHGLIDERSVEGHRGLRGGVVDAAHELGRVLDPVVLGSGIHPLRGVGELEVGSGGEPRRHLEDRLDDVVGGARVGRGFEDHGGAGREVVTHGAAGALDRAEIRAAAVAQRSGHADDHHVRGGDRRLVRGRAISQVEHLLDVGIAEVVHVGLARVQRVHQGLRDVEAVDGPSGAHRSLRERQPHVALPDDGDCLAGHLLNSLVMQWGRASLLMGSCRSHRRSPRVSLRR